MDKNVWQEVKEASKSIILKGPGLFKYKLFANIIFLSY